MTDDRFEKVRAEVERIFNHVKDSNFESDSGAFYYLKDLLEFIDALEVKESISVDLEKELDEWMKYGPHTSYPWCTIPDAIKITAEHFFALGLKAQKGEEV